MSFLPDLFSLQFGTDATWGSDAAATVKMMGVTDVKLNPVVGVTTFNQLRGTQAPGFETNLTRVGGACSIDGILTYEDFPHMWDALFGEAVSTEAAADTDSFTRLYNAPLVTRDTDLGVPSFFSFVYGDANTAATSSNTFAIHAATLQSLSISGEKGAPITYSANFLGKEVVEAALVDLNDRSVNIAMGDHVTISIDTGSDGAGNTPTSDISFNFNLNVNTNRELLYHLGSLYPTGYRDAKWAGTLTLGLEVAADSRAWLAAIVAASAPVEKIIRIRIADTDTSVAGTANEREILIDFAGVITGAPTIHDDIDGVIAVNLTFAGVYDTTAGNWLDVSHTMSDS